MKKRDGYRQAFADRDPTIVASYDEKDITELMQNSAIIRNKAKISAAIINAKIFLEIQKEFGTFSSYIRSFTEGKIVDNQLKTASNYQATSLLSDTVSKDLKQRGMKFVGSTIIYAHLQATGIINDHLVSCRRYHA